MEPDPAEIAGGDAPPCAEPPAAPTLYQSTVEPRFHLIINHCGSFLSPKSNFLTYDSFQKLLFWPYHLVRFYPLIKLIVRKQTKFQS